MRIVILGAGSIGTHIASQLVVESKDVVLIEKDPERAKHVNSRLDCLVLNEDGTSPETLKKAGIERADFFISVTDSDEVNMISSGIVSSEFDVPYKIARVRNIDYSHSKILGKKFLNIDFIVNPGIEAAVSIVNIVELGAISDVMTFEKTNVHMRTLFVDTASIFKDRDLREIKQLIGEEFLISAIARKNSVMIPSGLTQVRENDTLYLASTPDNLDKVFEKAGRPTLRIKDVVIVGGGTIGAFVAENLMGKGYRVKIIDMNYRRCKELTARYPDALVINADISDEGIFEEEQLNNSDLIIAVTDSQELNILSAAYGKSIGVKRSMAIVSKPSYLAIASELGIDATINPKSSAADTIIKFVRGTNVESVHSIFDGKAEVIEINVGATAEITGGPIKELHMPDSSLIISVNRDSMDYVPDGDFIINEGDNVLIISKKKSVPKIEHMFSRHL